MRLATGITKHLTAYSEFMIRLGKVSGKIQQAIHAGSITLRDHTIYTARKVGSSVQMELCQANDGKEVGFTNFDRRTLDANNYMCVTAIRLLAGNGDDPKAVEYGKLSGSQSNGELELKIGNSVIIDSLPLKEFLSGEDASQGVYRLEHPIIIPPTTAIVPTLKLSKAEADNFCVRIELHGVITAKA